jgi:hypothetical protein
MKHTIKLLFLCILIASGCKKDQHDRTLEIIGTRSGYDIQLSSEDKEDHSNSRRDYSKPANSNYTQILSSDRDYSLLVKSTVDSFNCQVIVDGKTIYNKSGKEHNIDL